MSSINNSMNYYNSQLQKNYSQQTTDNKSSKNDVMLNINCNNPETIKIMMKFEPRIQEYIKKKSYYQQNNINLEYPLENTYNITPRDLQLIRKLFENSNKNNQNSQNANNLNNLNSSVEIDYNFEAVNFTDKQRNSTPRCNLDQFGGKPVCNNNPSFFATGYSQNFNEIRDGNSTNLKTMKKNIQQTNTINDNSMVDINPSQEISKRRTPIESIDYKMANRRNNYCMTPSKSLIEQNVNNIDVQDNNSWKKVMDVKPIKFIEDNTYSRFTISDVGNNIGFHANRDYIDNNQRPMSCSRKVSSESQFDTCTKNVFPNQRLDKCYNDVTLNTAFYKAIPFMGNGAGTGDMDTGSFLRSGIETRGSRQKKESDAMMDRFEILDRDFQDPQHIIMEGYRGGYDSRQTDKLIRRNYYKII